MNLPIHHPPDFDSQSSMFSAQYHDLLAMMPGIEESMPSAAAVVAQALTDNFNQSMHTHADFSLLNSLGTVSSAFSYFQCAQITTPLPGLDTFDSFFDMEYYVRSSADPDAPPVDDARALGQSLGLSKWRTPSFRME